MAETSQGRRSAPVDEYGDRSGPPASGWAGWVAFAGVMLVMAASFQFVQGLVALLNNGFYAVRSDGLVVNVNYNTWGWIHIIISIVAGLTGVGLLAGNMVARWLGVLIAGLSALANLLFISAYPIWSTTVIAIDVIVIYAIIVHGRELKAPTY